MHPALLIGNYDWDPDRLPLSEFEGRVAAVGELISARGLAGLIVYGDAADHGVLAYLTGFTPKLGGALAFVGPDRDVWVSAQGGGAMIEAAKRLTWVEDVVSGAQSATKTDEWFTGLAAGGKPPRIGWAAGSRAPVSAMRPIAARSEGLADLEDVSDALASLMAAKRPLEKALIGGSAAILSRTVAAIAAAYGEGMSNIATIQAGEREARALRVADVRTLFSLDGGRVLHAFEGVDDTRTDPLVAYVAVRMTGYWAGGFVTLGERPNAARDAANAALAAMIAAARPGASGRDLAAARNAASRTHVAHPVTRDHVGNGIGLNLEEAPVFPPDGEAVLEVDGVYALQAGFADETAGNAMLSAIVAVGSDKTELLWPAAII